MKIKLFDRVIKQTAKTMVGLDIGGNSVKAVELSASGPQKHRLANIGYAKIGNPASDDSIVKAIKDCASSAHILEKEVSMSVSGPSVIIRFIELPRMSEQELRNAIGFEAEKYIPFDINEVSVDHQLLVPNLGNNMMLLLLVAAKKDYIARRLGLAGKAGLNVAVLDVASFADVNAFVAGAEKRPSVSALIDMGAKATEINIIDSGLLYFTRSIQQGGGNMTKLIAENLSCDSDEAEKLKASPGDKQASIAQAIEPILRNIIDEARLSFSYYENQSGRTIEKVYFTGGSSRAAGLRDVFKESIGVEAVQWDPTESLDLAETIDRNIVKSLKDQLGVAIGLALR